MIKVENLVWDEWNIAHIARHNIVPDEVEQVCQSDFEVEEADKGKLMVIGLTQAGRMLSVVLDLEPVAGLYYPITARSTSPRERRLYRIKKGVEAA